MHSGKRERDAKAKGKKRSREEKMNYEALKQGSSQGAQKAF